MPALVRVEEEGGSLSPSSDLAGSSLNPRGHFGSEDSYVILNTESTSCTCRRVLASACPGTLPGSGDFGTLFGDVSGSQILAKKISLLT